MWYKKERLKNAKYFNRYVQTHQDFILLKFIQYFSDFFSIVFLLFCVCGHKISSCWSIIEVFFIFIFLCKEKQVQFWCLVGFFLKNCDLAFCMNDLICSQIYSQCSEFLGFLIAKIFLFGSKVCDHIYFLPHKKKKKKKRKQKRMKCIAEL